MRNIKNATFWLILLLLTSCKALYIQKIENRENHTKEYCKIINNSFIGIDTLELKNNLSIEYCTDSCVEIGKYKKNEKHGKWYIIKDCYLKFVIKYNNTSCDTIYRSYYEIINKSW
jgi:hypothetical protein